MAPSAGVVFMLLLVTDWSSSWCQDHYLFQTHKDQDQPFTGHRSQTVGVRAGWTPVMEDKKLQLGILILISVQYTQHLHQHWDTRPTHRLYTIT